MGRYGILSYVPQVLVGFYTYMSKYAKNKTRVKFPQVNKTASNKAVMSSKVARNTTSAKDVSQSRLGNELDITLKVFGPKESTQDETKEVFDQGYFTNFQSLFRHKYYWATISQLIACSILHN